MDPGHTGHGHAFEVCLSLLVVEVTVALAVALAVVWQVLAFKGTESGFSAAPPAEAFASPALLRVQAWLAGEAVPSPRRVEHR